MRKLVLPLVAVLAAGALSGCEAQVKAPFDTQVCWHMVTADDGKPKFNVLTRNVATIEQCAADLEAMRLRFAQLGQQNQEVVGGYQGSFIWLEREGVFISQSLNGARYPALVRTGDGRLAIPGAMAQPPAEAPAAADAPAAKSSTDH